MFHIYHLDVLIVILLLIFLMILTNGRESKNTEKFNKDNNEYKKKVTTKFEKIKPNIKKNKVLQVQKFQEVEAKHIIDQQFLKTQQKKETINKKCTAYDLERNLEELDCQHFSRQILCE